MSSHSAKPRTGTVCIARASEDLSPEIYECGKLKCSVILP